MRANHGLEIQIGSPVVDFIGEPYMEHFLSNFTAALEGKSIMLEQELSHGDQQIWWQFNYNPAYDNGGNIIGISYNATDITSLKKSQQLTQERDRALDHIALVQSHEIRRPVSSIIGITELLKEHTYTKEMEEVHILELAVGELDQTIRKIVNEASIQIQT